ncbi:quinone oxidoreductase [bacteria symbiont BFo1 of Frankliniella occidentalis]|jgi:NADPH2:quinone reductase|uniref:Quinone oxidoreductase n=1 Tax=Erwinia aphidicola TaxID=68334 RepID=A0ABU8DJD9_ERWAP|nr:MULTISPECIES: quinone oxidoreductase [Erwinia]KMV68580.1 quinone oxidoreductase [bacteria symbiont BFo1 of Frankliniella occidentalis]VTT29182.1 quinone oxidoreductase [Klebsiella pneumoniae]KYP83352.1 quinone oxidoreductase [bacteria symbiont BFo1 of Frankliniella occidentalis]KYP88159.1 quinone oxidoreductase [bacteria symbiont BFo1 of Frankliniella occidentalis]MBD1375420.1 quinone oxidoreductase [Erwinia aphidicola]
MAKRIQISQHGAPEVMQLVDFDPADPAAGEVQVENKAIGINYIDTYVRSGLYPAPLPSGLGTEAAGVVTRVGPGVSELKPGDRVVYAQSSLGAYSEVHNVPVDKLALLPDAISFEQAAASFLKGLTVHYLLRQTYVVQPDEVFLFHAAAGGVGLIACQWAKALGAHLIGTVGSAEKAQMAKDAGAWATINYREENIAGRVSELTHGKKLRVVYDSVGKDTWEASLDCLQRRGLMVSFGNSSGPVTGVNLAILNQKGSLYVTRPSLNGYITTREALTQASNELFSLIASNAIRVDVPQAQKFALADAQKAHQTLESRGTQGSSLLIP